MHQVRHPPDFYALRMLATPSGRNVSRHLFNTKWRSDELEFQRDTRREVIKLAYDLYFFYEPLHPRCLTPNGIPAIFVDVRSDDRDCPGCCLDVSDTENLVAVKTTTSAVVAHK